MRNLKVLSLVIILIFTMGVLAACGSNAQQPTEPVTEETTAPAEEQAPAEQPAEETATDALKDGVYKVSYNKFDDHGWKAQVEVEVKDGKIANVVFDYVNKDGALKSKDEGYKAAMEKATKTYPEKAFAELQAALIEKQDIAAVEAVAGATASSNDFKALVKVAIEEMAKSGNTEPKEIPMP